MRCNTDHHTLNFVIDEKPALHHIAFEVVDWSEIHKAVDYLAKNEIHLVWGPGDRHLIPRVVERAKARQLYIVGDGSNRVDITYVENAAAAHILAADHLKPGSPVAGQAYFVSQGEPVVLWDFINQLLEKLEIPKITKAVSYRAAWAIGAILELLYGVLPLRGEPRMTRFLAAQLARSHYFDITKARRDLGYSPRVSTAEGLERLVREFRKR